MELDELSLHLRKYRKRVPGSEAEILPPDFMGTVWAEDMVPAVWNAELMRGSAGPALEPSSALSAKTDEVRLLDMKFRNPVLVFVAFQLCSVVIKHRF